ncbi:origin recognition complex subunit Orc4, putative [Metarhizium acridum CQMa 102]|uniref:Origin recognition complex subunit 4 n=1 Tax=Metarhizium acridum (strain CQMa 102) TaxID=655827 RepID=E9DUJ0_METAQ|nr:origin recognition complex subunit Orc4, putative [Metarhizium acridum CQMa 102]EFY92652.1 origin recognition complex subunit Orc4, putative [Metarhizium acridum CQMa 102]
MDQDVTPTGRKRSIDDIENNIIPETLPVKRRKLVDAAAGSPSTPKALTAIASAISGVFGSGRQSQKEVNGTEPSLTTISTEPKPLLSANKNGLLLNPAAPAAPALSPMKRPAIKIAALRGTIWDNGDLPETKKCTVPKRPAKQAGVGNSYQGPLPPASVYQPKEVIAFARKPGSTAGNKAQQPKGILTPTKKRGRPRKNVTFNRGADGEVFFDDLPKTPSARKPKAKAQKEQQEDDGIVCEICYKPDSVAPNEIILCDNCDFAVHQQCYDIAEIPEGDWLCKSCSQEDVLKTPGEPNQVEAKMNEPSYPVEVPDIPNLDQHLRGFQRVLLDRCSGRRRIRMFGQEEPYEKVRQLVEQTVVAGEGNSMLVIGPRGSGKTTLVENIIVDLSKEHGHEFHVVRLNGFIHTDDKLALKEIWRQLGKEMEVEDDLLNRANYADTMASLLALLSHPSEIMGTDENLTSQSVVFIIDEFDMFASHPRQTLLYNLYDIAQSRKAPIAVLGCTTRIGVVDMLEKRVKSRFSHRYVYLAPPKSLPAFWQICRQGLMIDKPDVEGEEVRLTDLQELYKQRQFQQLLQYHYFTTKSAAAFFTEWISPLASLSSRNLAMNSPTASSPTTSLAPPDSRLQLLSTLSYLELGLLIAAARLDIVAHTDTVNFAMAYDEYSSLVGKQRVQSSTAGMLAMGGSARVWSRGVAGVAWERLIALGLLVPAGIGGSRSLGHGGLDSKMWKVDVVLEEIPTAVKLSATLARWCREI